MNEIFLELVRLGIGNAKPIYISKEIDWTKIEALAVQHGLLAIVMDGMDKLPSSMRPPQEVVLQWIGEVLQNYEARYADYRKRIGELAGFYQQQCYKMMVLKGYGLSLNYPKPAHRPCGDIDIWNFGKYKEADAAIKKELGIKIDNGHHHHTVFSWKGYMVENHYDFVNVHYGHNNKELEIVFKDLAKDDSNVVEIDGHTVYLPSANLHALFLLRHCMQDFASAELNLRQVLDWAFFVEKHTFEIDWDWLNETVEKYNMKDFYNCVNAISVGDLGFNVKIFPQVQFSPDLKDKVLKEILHPSFERKEPSFLLPRLAYKYKRWKGNAWKRELCYKDSEAGSFFGGVWNHLLKPKTI